MSQTTTSTTSTQTPSTKIHGTSATHSHAQTDTNSFRKHTPDLSLPRFQTAKVQNAYEYAHTFNSKQQPPWLYKLTQAWQQLYEQPYRGVSTDGMLK